MKLHIENFKDYSKGYSQIDVPLNFVSPSKKLYDLLYDLQQFPHPLAQREMGLSEDEEAELKDKMLKRAEVQKEFDVLLQIELDLYQGEQDKELQQHMKRNGMILNPKNRPLVNWS